MRTFVTELCVDGDERHEEQDGWIKQRKTQAEENIKQNETRIRGY